MASRPFLILGNIIAIIVTVAAFFQAMSWPIAGVLVLVFLVFPLLASLTPSRGLVSSPSVSKTPATIRHLQTESKIPQHRPSEKHSTLSHQLSTKTDQRLSAKPEPVRPTGPKDSARLTPSSITAPKLSLQDGVASLRPLAAKPGPNFDPAIAKGDYTEYDIELEAGDDFSGEVSANGLVNVYLLDEDNLDNLDQGEEFWSETGEEGVENAKLEFTAQSKGKWFLVVENADDRAVSASVKIRKGAVSTALDSD